MFPRFHGKGARDSYRSPNPARFRLDEGNGRILLPVPGRMRYHGSRRIQGSPGNVTAEETGSGIFIAVRTERVIPDPAHPSESMIGIDMGIARLATLPDGTSIGPLNPQGKRLKRLAGVRRSLSRKRKGGRNRLKAGRKAARIQRGMEDARRDFLHKISAAIGKSHAIAAVEDLKARDMSASAGGTREEPGRHVAAKRGLNRAILDQVRGMFVSMPGWKLAAELHTGVLGCHDIKLTACQRRRMRYRVTRSQQ
jgi:putative transposase